MGEHTALSTPGSATGEGGGPVRVLIVEDHEVLSSSLAVVLDSEPDLQTVGRAGTLADARRAILETAPDVVVLDHQLPDGDGVASIEELRALREHLTFVVLTASTSDSVLVAAVHAGASGFVSKTDRKSTRLNSSHANISYAVFCLKKKQIHPQHQT